MALQRRRVDAVLLVVSQGDPRRSGRGADFVVAFGVDESNAGAEVWLRAATGRRLAGRIVAFDDLLEEELPASAAAAQPAAPPTSAAPAAAAATAMTPAPGPRRRLRATDESGVRPLFDVVADRPVPGAGGPQLVALRARFLAAIGSWKHAIPREPAVHPSLAAAAAPAADMPYARPPPAAPLLARTSWKRQCLELDASQAAPPAGAPSLLPLHGEEADSAEWHLRAEDSAERSLSWADISTSRGATAPTTGTGASGEEALPQAQSSRAPASAPAPAAAAAADGVDADSGSHTPTADTQQETQGSQGTEGTATQPDVFVPLDLEPPAPPVDFPWEAPEQQGRPMCLLSAAQRSTWAPPPGARPTLTMPIFDDAVLEALHARGELDTKYRDEWVAPRY